MLLLSTFFVVGFLIVSHEMFSLVFFAGQQMGKCWKQYPPDDPKLWLKSDGCHLSSAISFKWCNWVIINAYAVHYIGDGSQKGSNDTHHIVLCRWRAIRINCSIPALHTRVDISATYLSHLQSNDADGFQLTSEAGLNSLRSQTCSVVLNHVQWLMCLFVCRYIWVGLIHKQQQHEGINHRVSFSPDR